jgi:hypothetical protein
VVESPRVLSPDPLPHPYRNIKKIVAGDDDSSDTTDIEDARSTSETLEGPLDGDGNDDNQSRPPLVHRRSSLKKSNGSIRASMDATKNVAWAMDHDWQEQVKKYDAAAKEAETAGELLRHSQSYDTANTFNQIVTGKLPALPTKESLRT